jgi:hypothetical protein
VANNIAFNDTACMTYKGMINKEYLLAHNALFWLGRIARLRELQRCLRFETTPELASACG